MHLQRTIRGGWRAVLTLCVVCLLQADGSMAQRIPLLSESDYRYLVNEISGDSSYEFIRFMTQHHRPRGGTEGLLEVARYFERKAREFGLEDVRLIRQEDDTPSWHATRAELWMTQPQLMRICSMDQVRIHLADNSRSADLEAELIDVGSGTAASDYQGKDVKGKIVLAFGPAAAVMNEAVWKRGALGVVCYPNPSAIDYPLNSVNHPDQIRWMTIPLESSDGKPGTFGFSLSTRQGLALRARIGDAASPVRVRARVDATVGSDNWQVMVEAFIRGTDIGNQDVVITGHLQEEKFSANDDASGCANVLEIGRTLAKLIREGSIPRPRRNIRFWWLTEISSQRRFFADHLAESSNMLVNINQDMVGANQGQDVLRVQNITRVPFSRFHFLNDVVESIVEFTVASNTAQLAQGEAAGSTLYTRPILAHLGTRHRYNASMIPFHNSTDHMPFNEAPIGVPGVTFTNWPDNYIHTSDDDLWNIDRTQLQRNAFAVAAMACFIAGASAESVPALLAEMSGRASERMAVDYRVAQNLLLDAAPAEGAQALRMSRVQLDQALKRELRALQSLSALDGRHTQQALVAGATEQLQQAHAAFIRQIEQLHRQLSGAGDSPAAALSEVERELERMVVTRVGGPKEFLTGRSKLGTVTGLHSLMAFEVANFVDGKRNGLEIYHAVAAQARRAGSHYYGTVTPEGVRDYLKKVVASGLFAMKQEVN